MTRPVGNPGLKGKLTDKSVEAYILSLEVINSLSIKYRVETFAYLLCNAWELLLKAKVITDYGNSAVYYPVKGKEAKKSLALRDCLKKTLPDNDPVRANIERIAELRDEATHLVISKVPKEVLALFQSSVTNYHQKLNQWFQQSLSDRVSVGMMTIVFDFKPEDFDLTSRRLRKELGKETTTFLTKFQADLRKDYERFEGAKEFSVNIGYILAWVKKPDDADIIVASGHNASDATRTVEVPKDAGRTHPLRLTDLIPKVNQALGAHEITRHDIQCVNRVFGIEKRSEYFYESTVSGSPRCYSEGFVTWLADEYQKDNNFFTRTREKAKSLAGQASVKSPKPKSDFVTKNGDG